jgi:hypothetical protein
MDSWRAKVHGLWMGDGRARANGAKPRRGQRALV